MTPLRKRMIDDMVACGLAANTQATYIPAIRGLGKHTGRSPDTLDEADVREALTGADLVLLLTEWRDYTDLDPATVAALPTTPSILDGRNCLDVARWRAAGWTYRGLGRPNA